MFGGFESFFRGGHHEEESAGEIDNSTLYQLLDLQPGATQDEVKKAFRKKAMKEHPDKGGDPEKFKLLTEAYEVLGNAEKKELYDKYGMEGVKNGGGRGGDDIFSSMFGGGGGQRDKGQKKVKPRLVVQEVQLEQVYEGTMINLRVKRKALCMGCNGKGGSNAKTCTTCKGRKQVQKLVMLGPGMYQQTVGACNDCRGEGFRCEAKDLCTVCAGVRIVEQEKIIEVPLERGVPNEHDYVFYGSGDELPDAMAGDLHVRIKILPHKVYERRGADLFAKKSITLSQALTGVSFQLPYLDGNTLNISTNPGQIVKPNETLTLKGKGMSFYKDAMSHGNLNIVFTVEFPLPGSLNEKDIQALKEILPKPKGAAPKLDMKKLDLLQDFDQSKLNGNAQGGAGGKQENEEDDDDDDPRGGGGQRMQCAQQ